MCLMIIVCFHVVVLVASCGSCGCYFLCCCVSVVVIEIAIVNSDCFPYCCVYVVVIEIAMVNRGVSGVIVEVVVVVCVIAVVAADVAVVVVVIGASVRYRRGRSDVDSC